MYRFPARRRVACRLLAVLSALALFAAACSDDEGDDAAGDPADETSDDSSSTTTFPSTTAPIPESGEALEALQLNIVEFSGDGHVEIKNTGAESVTLAGVNICEFPDYEDLANITDLESLGAGETLEIPAEHIGGIDVASGEVALYNGTDFGSADAMLSYVQWGTGGHERASVAVEAALWPSVDDFVTPDPEFTSIESGGFAADPEGWS